MRHVSPVESIHPLDVEASTILKAKPTASVVTTCSFAMLLHGVFRCSVFGEMKYIGAATTWLARSIPGQGTGDPRLWHHAHHRRAKKRRLPHANKRRRGTQRGASLIWDERDLL